MSKPKTAFLLEEENTRMINISLEEAKAVQDLEEQHRKLIKVLGATHKYLSSVVEHPVYTYNKDAQQVAKRALEVMAEGVLD